MANLLKLTALSVALDEKLRSCAATTVRRISPWCPK
jgi:hypothetical protein